MSYNTTQIIQASLKNVESLNKKLNDIDSLHNDIKVSIEESAKIPGFFENLGIELNNSTENYLRGNNEVFKEKISEIKSQTEILSKEILRLEELDFEDHFNSLKDELLKSTREALRKELDKLDEKSSKFQTQINELKTEIVRLSKIDLLKHFENHQSKLSEIFAAVNSINGTLTSMLQNTIKITQSIGEIEQQQKIIGKEIKEQFEKVFSQLDNQNVVIKTNFAKTDTQISEIKTLVENNFKKQQIQAYITWGIIIISAVAIIGLGKFL